MVTYIVVDRDATASKCWHSSPMYLIGARRKRWLGFLFGEKFTFFMQLTSADLPFDRTVNLPKMNLPKLTS